MKTHLIYISIILILLFILRCTRDKANTPIETQEEIRVEIRDSVITRATYFDTVIYRPRYISYKVDTPKGDTLRTYHKIITRPGVRLTAMAVVRSGTLDQWQFNIVSTCTDTLRTINTVITRTERLPALPDRHKWRVYAGAYASKESIQPSLLVTRPRWGASYGYDFMLGHRVGVFVRL
jgi:hypothetical protein